MSCAAITLVVHQFSTRAPKAIFGLSITLRSARYPMAPFPCKMGLIEPVAGFTHTRCALFQPSLPHERDCARFLMGDDEVETLKVSPNAVPFCTWLFRTPQGPDCEDSVTVFQV